MKKQIIIFTRFSKKDGMGHFIRSKRLHDILKKNIFVNYTQIKTTVLLLKLLKNRKRKQ